MFTARPATADDLGTLVVLAREAIDELAQGRGGPVWRRRDARQEPIEPALATSLSASAAGGAQRVVMGTVDGTPVGYGVIRVDDLADGGRLARVEDLSVAPGARGVGVGESIMDLLIEAARAWGCIGVDAMALPGDRHTKNFFERFGLTARAIVVHRSLEPTWTETQ